MQGYCQELGKMVEMENIQTVRLTDLSYIHKGTYTEDGKTYSIFKKVQDGDIIVSKRGHFFPREVYVGKETPKNIISAPQGQTIIKDGGKDVIHQDSQDGEIKTLAQIKGEMLNEKKSEANP